MSTSTRVWPEHPRYLVPGVNDTWNEFQKFSRGKTVTPDDWKTARAALREEFRQYLAIGGEPMKGCDETFRCVLNFQIFKRELDVAVKF